MEPRTREQVAYELYSYGSSDVQAGGYALGRLTTHLILMADGVKGYEGPLWKRRFFPDGEVGHIVTLDSFEDYLLKPVRQGLGIPSLLWLSKIVEAHQAKAERERAFDILRELIPRFDDRVARERAKAGVQEAEAAKPLGAPDGNQNAKKGGGNKVDNINFVKKKTQGGTDPEYIIARLKRDSQTNPQAQALLDTLEAGDLSARQAALRMGYIGKTKSVPVDSPASAVRSLLKVFSADDLRRALDDLAV